MPVVSAQLVTKFEVGGLFGSQRTKPFVLDPENPTILTGSNGSGKSTVLKSIDAIGKLNFPLLQSVPFEHLVLEFRTSSPVQITVTDSGLDISRDGLTWSFSGDRYAELEREALKEADETPQYRRPNARQRVPAEVVSAMIERDEAEWVKSVAFPTLLIGDQRLRVARRTGRYASVPPRAQGQQVAAVNEFARELRARIQGTQSRYAKVSQELDEAFYRKVISSLDHPVPMEDVRSLLASVADAASRLRSVGLLGEEQEIGADPERLEAEGVRPVIKTFAEDALQKYAVLMPLQEQLRVFVAFLEKHYRDKQVVVTDDSGFRILLADGSILNPRQLSSGEQQILTLAYQLVFKTEPGTLVLIDEPELSLHVNWQQSLIDDLNSLGQQQDLSFLLATHSPTVIGDRPELVRSLD